MSTATPFKLDIQKLGERSKTANILVYGEAGVGKTTFAATAPRSILWLEAEGGTNSIGDTKGIDVVTMDGLESYREVLKYAQANPDAYETFVIDSISEVQAAILSEIMRGVAADDFTRDEFAPQFGEWGKLTGVMRAILRSYRDLPANVIFTALTREDKDELTGKSKVKPRLSPALAEEIPAFMDAVLYMGTSTEKLGEDADAETVVTYKGLLKPTGKYVAKLRTPNGVENVPTSIDDPTFDAVAALMGLGG